MKFTKTMEFGIPAIGFGTFGSDHADAAVVSEAVATALKAGYRHIDCAAVYGNEKEIGEVLRRAMAGQIDGLPGLRRDELWITSKLWNDRHAPGVCTETFKKSLSDLGLDYLDLYLVHWPFPNAHEAHCDVTSRAASARPYIHEEFMTLWHELEKLVDEGLVRHLGVSNMTRPKLELVLRDCRIRPAFNEMELHPSFQQKDFYDYVKAQGIGIIGYCPLGSPNRPERDTTADDVVDMEMPSVKAAAAAHRCGNAGHRCRRPELPAHKGTGIPVGRLRRQLAQALGRKRVYREIDLPIPCKTEAGGTQAKMKESPRRVPLHF